MINIDQIKLIDLIPPNLRSDETVKAAAEALDQQLQDIAEIIPMLAFTARIDDLPERWLDELAWQWHVDFYEPTLPIEQKRELVRNSFAWHRRKGTPSAVEELIQTIFYSGNVVEWWEYGSQPGYFKVVTTDPSATHERAQEFIKAVNSVKNARSWLERIEIKDREDMNLYFGNVLHMGEFMKLEQVV